MRLLRLMRKVRGFDDGLSKVKDIAEAARMIGALHCCAAPTGVAELRCLPGAGSGLAAEPVAFDGALGEAVFDDVEAVHDDTRSA